MTALEDGDRGPGGCDRDDEEREAARAEQRRVLKKQIRDWLLKAGGCTLMIEVYVVLGKALLNQQVTVEGMWRLSAAIRHAFSRVSSAFPLIIFTGWAGTPPAYRSEGELLKSFFNIFEESAGFRWRGGVLAEEAARNTSGNIRRALGMLHEIIVDLQGEFSNLRVVVLRFFLVSSEYHLERVEEVDEHLPEVSDLQPLRSEGREVVLLKAPYLYANCGNDLCEWLSTGYRQLHRLVLLQVNLQGIGGNMHLPKDRREKDIAPGSVGELRRVAFGRLPETIEVLERLVARKLDERSLSLGEWLNKYKKAREMIPDVLNRLRDLRGELSPCVGQSYDTWKGQWVGWTQCLYEATGELRTRVMDPDEPSHGSPV